MTYKVSVIIPMYNRAQYIGRALKSVFRQTLTDVEVIVVDDGSTDGSAEEVQRYQKEHPEVKLLCMEHKGVGEARNLGIKTAQGKYFIFLDSDDFIPEQAYELLYETAEEGQYDFVVGQLLRKVDMVNQGKWYALGKIDSIIRSYVGKNCAKCYDIAIANPSMCNRLIRRDFALENDLLYNGEIFGEDMVFNLKLFQAAKKATTIDEVVYCYETSYTRADSTISKMTLEPVLSGMRSIESYVLFFDHMGRIDWETDILLGPFEFIMQRFRLLAEEDKKIAFEEIKKYLKHYQNRKEYAIPITHIMGMDLDTLLLLPYSAYETCRQLIKPTAVISNAQNGDHKMAVLGMYQRGEIGFRFIIKYFVAWFRYKVKGKA